MAAPPGRARHDAAEQVEVREAHRVGAPAPLGQQVQRQRPAGPAAAPAARAATRSSSPPPRVRAVQVARQLAQPVAGRGEHDVVGAGARAARAPARRARPPRAPRSARGSCAGRCRRAAGGPSRGRPARGRRPRAAPARAGRAPRPRSRGGGSAGASAACASRAGRGSPTRPRRARAARASRPARAIASARSVGPGPSGSCPERSVEQQPQQSLAPLQRRHHARSCAPNVITPSRLPWRVARCPTASAAPSATSALRRSAVPKPIEADTSSSSHVVSVRSATWTRTCGSPVRAVAAQSIWRTSSPNW